AGTAEDDAAAAGVGGHGLRGTQHEDRVVIDRVQLEGAVVGDLVALGLEEGEQLLVQLEGGVVATDVDAHGSLLVCGGQSKMGPRVRLRLISKKPSVPATRTQPSKRRPASSPFGAGETTGPKKATSPTEITGVPTSSPT